MRQLGQFPRALEERALKEHTAPVRLGTSSTRKTETLIHAFGPRCWWLSGHEDISVTWHGTAVQVSKIYEMVCYTYFPKNQAHLCFCVPA